MLNQQDSDAPRAFSVGKRPSATSPQGPGEQKKKKKQDNPNPNNNKVLLFGRVRELALYRAEVLRQHGFQVITPSSRTEAVAAIEAGGVGAAILSYTLSSETVEEFAEIVKQKCPECALIAISQTGLVDRKITPDEIVIADDGPAALVAALHRTLGSRGH